MGAFIMGALVFLLAIHWMIGELKRAKGNRADNRNCLYCGRLERGGKHLPIRAPYRSGLPPSRYCYWRMEYVRVSDNDKRARKCPMYKRLDYEEEQKHDV